MTELEIRYLAADVRKLTAAVKCLAAAVEQAAATQGSAPPTAGRAAQHIETRIRQVAARPRAGRRDLKLNENAD
ncbi:hypothetical protein [Streptomyces sp. NPDC088801]|uniref:hypothetical protein n=1 Tax=Streptomyces sp. NPDC088801 TaxID=3365903 RepID=UPI00381AF4A5